MFALNLRLSVFVLTVLLLILSSDVCLNEQRLSQDLQQNQLNLFELFHLAQKGNVDAANQLSAYAIKHGDTHWLSRTERLGVTKTLVFLAGQSASKSQKQHYLTKAAENDHAPSQFALAELADNQTKRLQLLVKSAGNHFAPAAEALYRHFYNANDVVAANRWLPLAAKHDAGLTIRYAQKLWQNNQIAKARQIVQSSTFDDDELKRLKYLITHYWQPDVPVNTELTQKAQCAIRLQFFATSLLSMQRVDKLMTAFKEDERLDSLPMCINSPIWLAGDEAECSVQSGNRLACNLTPIIEHAAEADFSHAIVVGGEGKANVHNGIMYLDTADNYDVFVHEMAHFAGFVDEYPLTGEFARSFCNRKSAPNLVIQTSDHFLDTTAWNEITGSKHTVEISPSRTCDNTSKYAFKPVKETTFMEYHDLAHIPDVYLAIWQRQLTMPNSLTPIYVNFAQFYDEVKDTPNAQYWWQRYYQFVGVKN